MSDLIHITPALYQQDDLRRRLTITLNMTKVVQHIWESIRFENTESRELVFDPERPIRSTTDMAPWYTGKPCEYTAHSHINMCVYDSTWEASEAFELDRNPLVESWVKNDHLGYEVLYVYRGVVRKYRPDFIIRFRSGKGAGAGDQRAAGRAKPRQTPRLGTMGRSRQPARRLRSVVGGCFYQPRGH